VTFSSKEILSVSEFVVYELAGELLASEDHSVVFGVSGDDNIFGALIKIEVVSLHVVVLVLVEVRNFEVVDHVDQLVEVHVFGLGQDINVE